LARLGLPVEVIGKVGTDSFGDFVLNALAERGISSKGVTRDRSVGTSATMVMVAPDGERSFVHFFGANAHLTLEDVDLSMVDAGPFCTLPDRCSCLALMVNQPLNYSGMLVPRA